MSLENDVTLELTRLGNGGQIRRSVVISLLRQCLAALNRIHEQYVASSDQHDTVTISEEQTPVRTRVAKWNLGECKRCGVRGAQDGSYVVKIHGKGWWHDECFRIVRPSFYDGMPA